MSYLPRIIDAELDELLPALAAIAVEGAKGVGKTATAERHATSVVRLDERAQRAIAEADDRDVRHLHWLKERIGDDLLDAIVITTGPQAYRRRDGIGVVPAALFGI